jgi:hypothetical protein
VPFAAEIIDGTLEAVLRRLQDQRRDLAISVKSPFSCRVG